MYYLLSEIFNTSNIRNELDSVSDDEEIDKEEISVVEPLIRGAQVKNYIHELRRYI